MTDVGKIPLEDINFTGLLKEGFFSCIHLAQLTTKQDEIVIVKIIKEKHNDKYDDTCGFTKDTDCIRKVLRMNNNNIARMIGFCVKPELKIQAYVMTYEALTIGGRVINDLHTYLIYLRENYKKRDENIKNGETLFSPTDDELHSFAIQIATACQFLHKNQIIHGDLAARNILLDQNKAIKLTDFGLHCIKAKMIAENREKVIFRWSSPPYTVYRPSKEEDIWSFGVVLWEIGTLGGLPYSNYSNYTLDKKVDRGEKIILAPIVNSTSYLTLMIQSCLNECVPYRPDFQELIRRLNYLKCSDKECKFYNTLRFFNPDWLPDSTVQNNFSSDLREIKFVTSRSLSNLGYGAFGKTDLHKVKKPVTGHVNLVEKTFKDVFKKDPSFNDEIKDIHRKVGYHPNVAKIIALCTHYTTGLWLEYQSVKVCNGKIPLNSLREYLQFLRPELKNETSVNTEELGWFSLQIARGMSHLHKKSVVHGNLAARNLLINNAKIVKITDYFTRFQIPRTYENPYDREILPSCRWVSPEFIKNPLPTYKNDVWAFGITLWEIANLGATPFSDLEDDEIIKHRLQDDELLLPKLEAVSDKLWRIMNSCLEDNVAQRPTMKNIESQLVLLTSENDALINVEPQQEPEESFKPSRSSPIKIRKRPGEPTIQYHHSYPPRYKPSIVTPKRSKMPLSQEKLHSPASTIFPRRQSTGMISPFQSPGHYEQPGELNYQPLTPPLPAYQLQTGLFPGQPTQFQYPSTPYQKPFPPYQYSPIPYYHPCLRHPPSPYQQPLSPYQHPSPSFQNPLTFSQHPYPSYSSFQGQLLPCHPSFFPHQPSPPAFHSAKPPEKFKTSSYLSPQPNSTSGKHFPPPQIPKYVPHGPGDKEYIESVMASTILPKQKVSPQDNHSDTASGSTLLNSLDTTYEYLDITLCSTCGLGSFCYCSNNNFKKN